MAAYLLARLVGPLRTAGYRAGVCSVNREKAGELKTQMEQIAEASGLDGLVWKRSPAPGRVESSTGAVDVLCADRSAGHASGFDDAIVDELGLFQEKDRALVNGMRSSTSAKDGRFIALSIQGDAPFTKELIERADDPAVAVHLYRSPEGCTLDDPEAWAAANPGIAAGIKSSRYMEDEARRVLLTPADQGSFRAFDLNQPQAPGREMVCQVTDWQALPAPAERSGACVVGFDIGESASMSGFVACWPDTGRMEVFGAFADTPSLAERGMADGAGNLYVQMHDRGELRTYSGRVVPPGEFLKDCAARLAGVQVLAAGADRFRRDAVMTALDAAGIRWPMAWRGQGASATADGSSDVRAFQTWVLTGRLRPVESLVMASAIKESAIYRDRLGNPALHKARTRGRIDALSRRRDCRWPGGPATSAAGRVALPGRGWMSLFHRKLSGARWERTRRDVLDPGRLALYQRCGLPGALEVHHVQRAPPRRRTLRPGQPRDRLPWLPYRGAPDPGDPRHGRLG